MRKVFSECKKSIFGMQESELHTTELAKLEEADK